MTTRIQATSTGNWLKAFDPEFANQPGTFPTGHAEFSPNKDEALVFESRSKAFDFWWTQSRTVPRRPDGKANRPLTAFTVEFVDE